MALPTAHSPPQGLPPAWAARRFCGAPFNGLMVHHSGQAQPCCFISNQPYAPQLVLGDLTRQSLRDVLTGPHAESLREGFLTGELNPVCADCFGCQHFYGYPAHEPALTAWHHARQSSQPLPLTHFRRLELEITDHCNLRCVMCSLTYADTPHIGLPEGGFMDFALFERLIRDFAGLNHETKTIALNWLGESFLHPRFLDMLRVIDAYPGLEPQIITNALVFDTPAMDAILALRNRSLVAFSIHAVSPETYRRVTGSTKYALVRDRVRTFLRRRAQTIIDGRMDVQIRMTVMPENAHEAPAFVHEWAGFLASEDIEFAVKLDDFGPAANTVIYLTPVISQAGDASAPFAAAVAPLAPRYRPFDDVTAQARALIASPRPPEPPALRDLARQLERQRRYTPPHAQAPIADLAITLAETWVRHHGTLGEGARVLFEALLARIPLGGPSAAQALLRVLDGPLTVEAIARDHGTWAQLERAAGAAAPGLAGEPALAARATAAFARWRSRGPGAAVDQTTVHSHARDELAARVLHRFLPPDAREASLIAFADHAAPSRDNGWVFRAMAQALEGGPSQALEARVSEYLAQALPRFGDEEAEAWLQLVPTAPNQPAPAWVRPALQAFGASLPHTLTASQARLVFRLLETAGTAESQALPIWRAALHLGQKAQVMPVAGQTLGHLTPPFLSLALRAAHGIASRAPPDLARTLAAEVFRAVLGAGQLTSIDSPGSVYLGLLAGLGGPVLRPEEVTRLLDLARKGMSRPALKQSDARGPGALALAAELLRDPATAAAAWTGLQALVTAFDKALASDESATPDARHPLWIALAQAANTAHTEWAGKALEALAQDLARPGSGDLPAAAIPDLLGALDRGRQMAPEGARIAASKLAGCLGDPAADWAAARLYARLEAIVDAGGAAPRVCGALAGAPATAQAWALSELLRAAQPLDLTPVWALIAAWQDLPDGPSAHALAMGLDVEPGERTPALASALAAAVTRLAALPQTKRSPGHVRLAVALAGAIPAETAAGYAARRSLGEMLDWRDVLTGPDALDLLPTLANLDDLPESEQAARLWLEAAPPEAQAPWMLAAMGPRLTRLRAPVPPDLVRRWEAALPGDSALTPAWAWARPAELLLRWQAEGTVPDAATAHRALMALAEANPGEAARLAHEHGAAWGLPMTADGIMPEALAVAGRIAAARHPEQAGALAEMQRAWYARLPLAGLTRAAPRPGMFVRVSLAGRPVSAALPEELPGQGWTEPAANPGVYVRNLAGGPEVMVLEPTAARLQGSGPLRARMDLELRPGIGCAESDWVWIFAGWSADGFSLALEFAANWRYPPAEILVSPLLTLRGETVAEITNYECGQIVMPGPGVFRGRINLELPLRLPAGDYTVALRILNPSCTQAYFVAETAVTGPEGEVS